MLRPYGSQRSVRAFRVFTACKKHWGALASHRNHLLLAAKFVTFVVPQSGAFVALLQRLL
jgi:hypothetical protein